MKGGRVMLAVAGLALVLFAMSYGFYYAVWVEHQTLDHIGGALAGAFQSAARGQVNEARAGFDDYARAKYVYTREVDAHSHWGGLGMILLVLAALWDRLSFGPKGRSLLAGALVVGCVLFPLGVLLQNYLPSPDGQAVAVAGSALLIVGLVMVAVGFVKERAL